MKEYKLAVTLMLLASCIGLSAQDGSVYERGATYLENTMPPSPSHLHTVCCRRTIYA